MKPIRSYLSPLFVLTLAASTLTLAGPVVDSILEGYTADGASEFDEGRGAALWNQTRSDCEGELQGCGTCHGYDLKYPGKHIPTDKGIGPMALSVNPTRYRDTLKLEKWFERDCKRTFDRVCTPQEKGDILLYLSRQ